jgi:hypothetical protein
MSRALFALALICAAPAFAETRFFGAVEDLPLAPGLAEIGAGFSFSGADGRIIAAEAEGRAAPGSVRDFYLAALPALGWSFSPGGEEGFAFRRGRERLTLLVSPRADGSRLEARLVVRPAAMSDD